MIILPSEKQNEFMGYTGGTGLSTGFSCLDKNLKLRQGYLVIASGYPGAGKSEFFDALMQNMGLLYGWKTLFYSPENFPVESHWQKISERFIGKRWSQFTQKEKLDAHKNLKSYFGWVDPEAFANLDMLLEYATAYKAKHGLDCFIIDPWNQLQHKRDELVHEYLSNALAQLIHFARKQNVLTVVITHPKTPVKDKNGQLPVPGMYDLSDGAMWRNKADYGLMLHRENFYSRTTDANGDIITEVDLYIMKLKQKWMGSTGCVKMHYHVPSGRYKGAEDTEFSLPKDFKLPF